MSSSDESDGIPLIGNDDDSSSDDSDDPFSFQAHSFKKKKPVVQLSQDSDIVSDSDSDISNSSGSGSEDKDSNEEDTISSSKRQRRQQKHATAVKSNIIEKRRRGKKKGAPTVDEKLQALERHKRKHFSLEAALKEDEDSDNDIQILGSHKTPTSTAALRQRRPQRKHSEVICLDSDASESDDDNAAPMQLRGVGFDTHTGSGTGVSLPRNRDTMDSIHKARMARQQLRMAQQYHAEDVNVPLLQSLPNNPLLAGMHLVGMDHSIGMGMGIGAGGSAVYHNNPMNPMAIMNPSAVALGLTGSISPQGRMPHAAAILPTPASAANNLGHSVLLTLRTTELINGKKQSCSTTTRGNENVNSMILSIRANEPFQRLIDKYVHKKCINSTITTVSFTFDGQKLDPAKAPSFYEMEEEDLIDVLSKTTTILNQSPGATRTTASTLSTSNKKAAAAMLGPSLMLTLRTQEIKNGKRTTSRIQDILSIRQKEPLNHLLNKYKKKQTLITPSTRVFLTFDGDDLDLQKTPAYYEMEDEDMIDVTIQR